jgi:hypothetical protein
MSTINVKGVVSNYTISWIFAVLSQPLFLCAFSETRTLFGKPEHFHI